MRFTRLRLSNFKPYGDVDVGFRDGVTVIHGLNGSGKSSLLEACFFALYGSKALPGTLGDIIRNGEDDASIELWFTHEGVDYSIERQLRRSGERVSTSKCVLEGDDGSGEPISRDGARAVRNFVTDLLRMDAEAFVNCAYVRQGEVNKLINATPQQRQDMIDDLLQLGMLETYRDRAGQARLGVEDVLTAARGSLETITDQIEDKESQNLHSRLNERETDRTEIEDKISHYEDQQSEAESTLEDAEDVLSEYEDHQAEIEELAAEIEEMEAEISRAASTKEDLGTERREARQKREELELDLTDHVAETELATASAEAIADRKATVVDRQEELGEEIADLRVKATGFENQAENLEATADDLDTQAETAETAAEEAESEAEEAETAAEDAETKRDELADEQSTLRARFEGTSVEVGEATAHRKQLQERRQELGERVAETNATLDSVRESLSEAEELLAEGNCPTCGQPVEDAPHVTGIDEKRERIEALEATAEERREKRSDVDDQLATATELVEAESKLSDLNTERERLADRIETHRETAKQKREAAEEKRSETETKREEAAERREAAEQKREEAVDTREEIDAATERRAEITEAIERLETITEMQSEIDKLSTTIDRLTERRESLAERNEERRNWLADKRDQRDELREAFDESTVEDARADKQRAENYLDNVGDELATLRANRDELQNAIGGIKADIKQLETLREEHSEIGNRVDRLESVHEETEQLEAMYGELRTELRRRNVESLERMLNETFDLVYGNDAYSHIELDGQYELTVYQKDDQPLEPEQLSGGERALFNLSLRCAIYRLLAEGIEGSAPTPPLILDEPTVFLDSGHVGRLVDLVEEMRGFGVRQILIVSHDDELVGAADELITVEKNPTTNQSTVSQTDEADLAILGQVGDD
ncbi:exonuclease SbcC [Halohasta litchfieldiae]|jgi:exonuclease SbcC|uniref:DNA double-strand break repair Rad50 ATPase n=1 Tax=Halohasta litchfieldiae TaxID=1073996 RepID=A0A1H6TBD3_9EURY|nr:DNA double-strand break repair ATPase Rad50 [Halohasta litchfieldiae]ATW87763.1 exonuclease SbcC [Halohasta litchfieldiae]SEI74407.1 exonuclease SbcC [Halohasta litchfieldiae]